MFNVFNKKEDINITYIKRLQEQEETILTLKNRVVSLEVDFDTLRNKVLRKIQLPQNKEIEEQKEKRKAGQPVKK